MKNSKNEGSYKDRDTLAKQLKALRLTPDGKEKAKELLEEVQGTKGYINDRVDRAIMKVSSEPTLEKEVEVSKEMQRVNDDIVRGLVASTPFLKQVVRSQGMLFSK